MTMTLKKRQTNVFYFVWESAYFPLLYLAKFPLVLVKHIDLLITIIYT